MSEKRKRVLCGCTADTELGMASGCALCGHRDHGRSGCRVIIKPGLGDK